ncbi:MAG: hybrid sensor histidine kinase/response regulator [Cyanobacteria bacterium REEB65]|nr:hybrid sensor histidine kinase/response regulator [Cyanobacteria bacterium REEB65]
MAEPSGATGGRPLDVLIVEDSEDDALLIVRHLTKAGLSPRYRRVETPDQLQEALVAKPWDLVLCDYLLPEFAGGLEALGILKSSGLDLPVVMLSGVIDEEKAVRALRAGAVDFVRKGDLSRLVPAIERELREASDRQERKRAEAELARQAFDLRKERDLRQYREDLLAVFSHEFRTPLHYILASADILDQELFGPINPQQRQQLERIFSGIERLLFLVDNFLLLAALKAGTLTLSMSESDYPKLVLESVRLSREANREHGLVFFPDVHVGESWILDPTAIGRVLGSLLDNAVKVSKPGQRIEVKAYVQDGMLVTQVVDQGPGIVATDLARIFEPFEQVDSSATRAIGGVGLGLAVCKAIVEAHGGKIGVISAPGQGSTFWFILPRQGGVGALQVPELAARAQG